MVQVEKGDPVQDLVFPGPPAHYRISLALADLGKLTSNGLAGMEGQSGRWKVHTGLGLSVLKT